MDYVGNVLRKLTCKKRKFFKIFMFGLDGSGKTSLIYNWKTKNRDEPIPTHGFNVESIDRGHTTLVVWDLGKRTLMMSVKELWRRYFALPHLQYRGLIFVVDSADVSKLNDAKEELHGVLEETDEQTLLLVLANKQDLSSALSVQEMIESLELNECKVTWHILGTSATSGQGLNEALDWLFDKLQTTSH